MGVIFRASITLRNGRVLFAKDFGLKAFRIEVDEDQKAENESTAVQGGAIERS